MKLKDGLIQTEVNGEYYLADSGKSGKRFNGMVKLNETGAFIIKQLGTDTDTDTLVRALCSEYRVDEDKALNDTRRLLDALDKAGLLIR